MTQFDRLLSFMTKPFVILGYLLFVVISFYYWDRPIANYFHALDPRTNLWWLSAFSKLGLGILYLVSFFGLALFFRYIKRHAIWESRAWFLWFCVLIPSLICVVLKILLGRARPDLWFTEQLYGFYGVHWHAPFWSFPSGHTTSIMGVALGLSALFPRYWKAWVLMGLSVAASRVILTHHFLTDVLAASYLALVEVGILAWWWQRKGWIKDNQ